MFLKNLQANGHGMSCIFCGKSKLASHYILSSEYITDEACSAAAPPVLHKRAARSLRRVSKTNTDSWTAECVSRATGSSQLCPGTSLCPNSCSLLLAAPGHWAMSACTWSGWSQGTDDVQTTLPPFCLVTSSLSRKILPTTITNVTFLFMAKKATYIVHQQQQLLIIKEPFDLWTFLNWHRAVPWIGVKVWNSWGDRIWEAFRSRWESGEDWPWLTGQFLHSHLLIPSQQHHVANQKYKSKKNLMVEI